MLTDGTIEDDGDDALKYLLCRGVGATWGWIADVELILPVLLMVLIGWRAVLVGSGTLKEACEESDAVERGRSS